ncbi:MAG: adenylate/guanylate cyclase domain-containing protein [Verrucomicrobiota bacterium]
MRAKSDTVPDALRPGSALFLSLALGLVLAVVLLCFPGILSRWEWACFDQALRWRLVLDNAPAVDGRITYVNITDADTTALGSVAEEYAALARLVEEASAMGAAAIVFDVVFRRAKQTEARPLYEAIQRSARVVLAEALLEKDSADEWRQRARSFAFGPRLTPAGLANAEPDADGVFRHYAYVQRGPAGAEPSLALATYLQVANPGRVRYSAAGVDWEELGPDFKTMLTRRLPAKPQLLNLRSGWMRSGKTAFMHSSLGQIHAEFQEWKKRKATSQPGAPPREGQILLVGYVGSGLGDTSPTPFGPVEPRVQLHAAALNDLLQNRPLHELPPWSSAVAVLSVWLFGSVSSYCARKSGLAVLAFLGVALWALVGVVALFRFAAVLPFAAPAGAWVLGGTLELARRHTREWHERIKLRTTLEFYFSPGVIEHIVAKPGALEPQSAELTVLISDLRNFTSLTERSQERPEVLYGLLNRTFSIQTQAVHARRGNLEHFLGDQFTAYWGAPESEPLAADLALAAALEIVPILEALRPELSPEFRQLFGFGFGLHCGRALVGNVGGRERLDYMVLGDVVNTAARVESLTKLYGVPLLLTGELKARLTQPLLARMIDRVIVKGKSTGLELWQPADGLAGAHLAEMWQRYTESWALYEQGRFGEAAASFDELFSATADLASRALAIRCRELALKPPPDWQGTFKMAAK